MMHGRQLNLHQASLIIHRFIRKEFAVPIVLECPSGHKSFVKDEHAGKKARCPVCKAIVVVPDPRLARADGVPVAQPFAPPPPVVPRDEVTTVEPIDSAEPRLVRRGGPPEEEPAQPQKKGSRREALDKVHRGLGFHYAKQMLFLVNILLLMMTAIFNSFGSPSSVERARGGGSEFSLFMVFAALTAILSILGILAAPVLGIIGSVFCSWVPAKAKAKGLIVASLGLDVIAIPLPAIGFISLGFLGEVLLHVVQFGFMIASWALFMLFLKALAAYLNEEQAEDEAGRLLLKGFLMLVGLPIGILIAMVFLALFFFAGAAGLGLARGGNLFTGGIALMVLWFIVTVNYLFEILTLIGNLRNVLKPDRLVRVPA